jgi:hypothetical protein
MEKSFSKRIFLAFGKLDPKIKEALANIEKPILLSYAALAIVQDYTDQPDQQYLSTENIVEALGAAGIAINHKQVNGALSRAGQCIKRKVIKQEMCYRLMTVGRRKVEPLLQIGPIQIIYIEGNTPKKTRIYLKEIMISLKGLIRICDPYYGIRSLEILSEIQASCSVRFLTSKTNEKTYNLTGPIGDFKREHPNVEIRVLAPPNILHDRYILAADVLFILGHGIKDIGDKDSFIVTISKSYAEDVLKEIELHFDILWGKGNAL